MREYLNSSMPSAASVPFGILCVSDWKSQEQWNVTLNTLDKNTIIIMFICVILLF